MTQRFLTAVIMLVALAACAGGPGPVSVQPGAENLTPVQLDSLWRSADTAFKSGKWDDALQRYQRFLLEVPPGDPRVVEAHMMMGESQFAKKNRLDAAREFRRVSDETPTHPLAPAALLRVADAYAALWRRPELDPSYGQSALATYQELLSRYPDSEAAKTAQAKIAELNNWFAAKAFKAARYYLRLKAYDSAIIYLRDLLATYPRADVAPEALGSLIRAYRTLGYVEDVRETCQYLRRFHPDAPEGEESCAEAPPAGVTPVRADSIPPLPPPADSPSPAAAPPAGS
jgi:outer membrane protein assembly factor BamD